MRWRSTDTARAVSAVRAGVIAEQAPWPRGTGKLESHPGHMQERQAHGAME